eukprot:3934369-Rhodomonas_salina.1
MYERTHASTSASESPSDSVTGSISTNLQCACVVVQLQWPRRGSPTRSNALQRESTHTHGIVAGG